MEKFRSIVLGLILALGIFCGITVIATFAINIILVSFGLAQVSKLFVGAIIFLLFLARFILK